MRSFEGRRAAHQPEEIVFLPGLRRAGGHDLLGEDVEGRHRRQDPVEPAMPDTPHQARTLDELVAGERIEPPLRRAAAEMTRATHTLQEGGEAAR